MSEMHFYSLNAIVPSVHRFHKYEEWDAAHLDCTSFAKHVSPVLLFYFYFVPVPVLLLLRSLQFYSSTVLLLLRPPVEEQVESSTERVRPFARGVRP